MNNEENFFPSLSCPTQTGLSPHRITTKKDHEV